MLKETQAIQENQLPAASLPIPSQHQKINYADASEKKKQHDGQFHSVNQKDKLNEVLRRQLGEFVSIHEGIRTGQRIKPDVLSGIDDKQGDCNTEKLHDKCGSNYKLETSVEEQTAHPLINNGGDFVSLHKDQNKDIHELLPPFSRGREIGRGAFGKCYEVHHVESGLTLVSKEITFDGSSDKVNEKSTAWKEFTIPEALCHPNIIRVHCVLWAKFKNNKSVCSIYMEYMPGGSVAAYLHDLGKGLDEPVIINYTQQVLCGMSYMHSKNILHRDFKGANLLLSTTGAVLKIGDFGCATEVESLVKGVITKKLCGTVPFMAPEVVRDQNYSSASDVWSLGCCIIEMATGKPPWNAVNCSEGFALIYKIGCLFNSPDRLKDLTASLKTTTRMSTSLERLTLSCLEIEKDKRPSTDTLLRDIVFFKDIRKN